MIRWVFRAARIIVLAGALASCKHIEGVAEAPTASVTPSPPPAPPPKPAPVVVPPAPPVDPWAPVGCDQPFPSAGTRFVESEDEVSAPIGPSGPRKLLVVIESVAGGTIERAQFARDTSANADDGGPFWQSVEAQGSKVFTTTPARGAGEPITVEATEPDLLTLIGPASLSVAIASSRAKGGMRDLERALEVRLGDTHADETHAKVTVGAPKTKDDVDVYPVTARIHGESSGMCHTYIHDQSLRGELTVRTTDAAFVDLSLSGTDLFKEGVCSGAMGIKKFAAPTRAKAAIHIRRECFAQR
jgi:hypothetical protein